MTNRQWNSIPEIQKYLVVELALEYPELSSRELAFKITDEQGIYLSKSSVYRILKQRGLIPAPNHILIAASNEFKDKTQFVHQMWQTDFTYFKIIGWGWYYLSTVLDDYSRYIIHWEPYDEMYSFEQNKAVFTNAPRANTIDVLFVGAYYNEGNDDKDYKTLLKVRNNLKVPLNYKADIKYYFNDDFENTSIVGAYPGTDTQEIWQHKIDFIALYDFEILQFLNEE